MPVLIEGITVVVSRERIQVAWPAGWEEFRRRLRPEWQCDDSHLFAILLPGHEVAAPLLRTFEQRGLRGDRWGEYVDFAVISQATGPLGWSSWLELARVPVPGGGTVLAARAAGSDGRDPSVPAGWRYAGSRSATRGTVQLAPADRPLRFLRREPLQAVYVDRFNGEEVHVPIPDPSVRLTVRTECGDAHELTAELVRDRAAIEVGLMFRETLGPGAGMLFVFDDDSPRTFWMKNTRVPLDMLFLDRDGWVVKVEERTTPMTTAPWGTHRPCRAVLEVNAGWAAAHGVGVGARVELPALASAPRVAG